MPTEPSRVRRQLGYELKRLRSIAGLPQRAFDEPARQQNLEPVPHPRVHRTEQGAALLTEAQLSTWLQLTGADDDTRERLWLLLQHAHSEQTRWSTATEDRPHLQQIAADRERDTGLLSVYEHAHLPGLLQTQSYARALLAHFRLDQDDAEAAAARIRRQELLHEPGHQFRFVVTEHALQWSPAPDVSMPGQRDRVTQLAELDAVSVLVLPSDVRHPMSGFVLHEQMTDGTNMVAVELEHGELVLVDPTDVDVYRRLFGELYAAAWPITEF